LRGKFGDQAQRGGFVTRGPFPERKAPVWRFGGTIFSPQRGPGLGLTFLGKRWGRRLKNPLGPGVTLFPRGLAAMANLPAEICATTRNSPGGLSENSQFWGPFGDKPEEGSGNHKVFGPPQGVPTGGPNLGRTLCAGCACSQGVQLFGPGAWE